MESKATDSAKSAGEGTEPVDVVRDEGLMPEVGGAVEAVEPAPAAKKRMSDKTLYIATSLLTTALRVGTGLVMARMLSPTEFGIVATVILIPNYLGAFGDAGVSRALVQFRDDDRNETEDSAFLVTLGVGGIVMLAMAIAGVYYWQARHDVNLLWVGVLSGVNVMLSYIYQFQMACMNRDMKFRTEAKQNLIFSLTTMATGVTMASTGFGMYAVVMQPLSAQILANIAIYRKHPIRFPRAFTKKCIKKILGYGGRVTLVGFIQNLQVAVANTIVKWHWFEPGLGMLGKAWQIRDMAGQNIAAAVDRMLAPLMRAQRDKQDKLRHLFLRGATSVALPCTFGWAVMTAIAPEMIQVVMGPKWATVSTLLRMLAPALFYLPLLVASVAVANAVGNNRIWLWSSLLGLFGVMVGMLVGQMWGLEACVLGLTLGQLLWVIPCAFWAMKTTKTRRRQLAIHLASIFFAGMVSCAAMFAMRSVMAYDIFGAFVLDPSPVVIKSWRLLLNMFAVVAVGGAVYFGVNWVLSRQAMGEMLDMVRRKKS